MLLGTACLFCILLSTKNPCKCQQSIAVYYFIIVFDKQSTVFCWLFRVEFIALCYNLSDIMQEFSEYITSSQSNFRKICYLEKSQTFLHLDKLYKFCVSALHARTKKSSKSHQYLKIIEKTLTFCFIEIEWIKKNSKIIVNLCHISLIKHGKSTTNNINTSSVMKTSILCSRLWQQ